jgi:hypothetical protein
MGTIAFFPWARLRTSMVHQGHFSLIPFDTDANPLAPKFAEEWELVKSFISNYHELHGKPVKEAAMLLIDAAPMASDFTDDQLELGFMYREILCTAALSSREYFSHTYFNADNLRLVIQRVAPENSGMLSIVSRRRDGSQTRVFAPGIFRETRPFHVTNDQIHFDQKLAVSLLQAFDAGGDDWQDIEDAIRNFNAASSDSSQIHQRQELGITVAAIERVLGSEHTEKQLAAKFTAALSLLGESRPKSGGRQRNAELSGFESTREAWLRDLYRLRNPYTHGRTKPRYASMWTTQEHILLTSFIFPILLKIRLQAMGKYSMVDDDFRQIYYFDQLLALSNVLAEGREGATTYAWCDVIYDGRWAWLSERENLMP